MAGEMEVLFSLAGRIYVLLRRESNRMIDVEWFIVNADYALEVLRLAQASKQAELVEHAQRTLSLHPLLAAHRPIVVREKTVAPVLAKYVTCLR
ncbi:MAG: hypothetical protein HOO97_09955 [Sideroxydans sp.]|nr:hypothetical protein [Sideroxydans sp.]NOT99397.1 hypothetical protein [Sideroxydans sp.]